MENLQVNRHWDGLEKRKAVHGLEGHCTAEFGSTTNQKYLPTISNRAVFVGKAKHWKETPSNGL